jgi:hypothetical protein
MAPAQATAPKGCCKAPVAPKTDAKLKEGAPVALSIASFVACSPARSSTASIDSVSVRLARRAHHAEAPDDSPPDRLSQLHILLI